MRRIGPGDQTVVGSADSRDTDTKPRRERMPVTAGLIGEKVSVFHRIVFRIDATKMPCDALSSCALAYRKRLMHRTVARRGIDEADGIATLGWPLARYLLFRKSAVRMEGTADLAVMASLKLKILVPKTAC